jgi:hypothetical protein
MYFVPFSIKSFCGDGQLGSKPMHFGGLFVGDGVVVGVGVGVGVGGGFEFIHAKSDSK